MTIKTKDSLLYFPQNNQSICQMILNLSKKTML